MTHRTAGEDWRIVGTTTKGSDKDRRFVVVVETYREPSQTPQLLNELLHAQPWQAYVSFDIRHVM